MISARLSFAAVLSAAAIASFLGSSASAQQNDNVRTADAIETLFACLEIKDNDKRLACYDKEVRSFSAAEDKGDIIVAERKDVEKARRDVFGLSVSENPIFGKAEDEGINSIETTIQSARQLRSGKWLIVLEEGGSWSQTDLKPLRRSPKAGQTVIIERGILGSFVAQIDGRRAFKVKRLR